MNALGHVVTSVAIIFALALWAVVTVIFYDHIRNLPLWQSVPWTLAALALWLLLLWLIGG